MMGLIDSSEESECDDQQKTIELAVRTLAIQSVETLDAKFTSSVWTAANNESKVKQMCNFFLAIQTTFDTRKNSIDEHDTSSNARFFEF